MTIKKKAQQSMHSQWSQTLYQVAFLISATHEFYARIYEGPPSYLFLFEHRGQNTNSESLNANLENLNYAGRLNVNSEYFRQHNQKFYLA